MHPQGKPEIGDKLIVRRGRVDSVDIFEVKENELELLEKGSPASLQLNFSVFLLSIAFSAILTLATATVKWPIMETVFVVVSVIGILLGVYLFISWWKTRSSIASMINIIRQRIPPEAMPIKESVATKTAATSANPKAPAG
jgi:hypothetical protein